MMCSLGTELVLRAREGGKLAAGLTSPDAGYCWCWCWSGACKGQVLCGPEMLLPALVPATAAEACLLLWCWPSTLCCCWWGPNSWS